MHSFKVWVDFLLRRNGQKTTDLSQNFSIWSNHKISFVSSFSFFKAILYFLEMLSDASVFFCTPLENSARTVALAAITSLDIREQQSAKERHWLQEKTQEAIQLFAGPPCSSGESLTSNLPDIPWDIIFQLCNLNSYFICLGLGFHYLRG